MPDDLQAFLKAGEPPVFITFGSTKTFCISLVETARLMIEAVRLGKFRAVIQSRWEDLRGMPEDARIYRLGFAPYQHIFPRCAAVAHHGGEGTTHLATSCGCPSVVVEHALDQRIWGVLLHRGGGISAQAPASPVSYSGKACQGCSHCSGLWGDGNKGKSGRQGRAGRKWRHQSRRTYRVAVCRPQIMMPVTSGRNRGGRNHVFCGGRPSGQERHPV
jgi:hypothetical protein